MQQFEGERVTSLEDKLRRYKNPSSDHEKDKQDRAERMVRSAVDRWADTVGLGVSYLPKGSYANNTNVKLDSDVDIAVIHGNGQFYRDETAIREQDRLTSFDVRPPTYSGLEFRTQLVNALVASFGVYGCDTSGKTAIEVVEGSSRVKADVVPSYEYRRYVYNSDGRVAYYPGQIVFRTDGTSVVNYPKQQYDNGIAKNNRTGTRYKQLVRILKNIENELVREGKLTELPSYFMECLVYVVPDDQFGHAGSVPLTDDLKAVLLYIWNRTDTGGAGQNWYEPNDIKKLFGAGQPWSMQDARDLTAKAWNHYGLGT